MNAREEKLVRAAHRLYKVVLSPLLRAIALGPGLATQCKFQPTCSDYAALALAQHGPARGVALAAWRVLRCHPLAHGGWDPVPPGPARAEKPARYHR